MDIVNVSIAEGRKNFSKLIKAAEGKKQRIVISRRGSPVAIILPYDEFERQRKIEALKKIDEVRAIYLESGIAAQEAFEASRQELEEGK